MRLCAADVILQLLQTFLQRSEDPEFHGNHNKILLWSRRDASGMSKTKSSPAKPIPNGIRAGKMRLWHRTAAGPGPAPFPAGEFPEPVLTLWSWDSIQAPGKRSGSSAGSGRRAWIGIQILGKMRELGLEPQDPPRGPKALGMKFPQNQARFGKFFKLASPHLWPQFLGKRGFSEFSTRFRVGFKHAFRWCPWVSAGEYEGLELRSARFLHTHSSVSKLSRMDTATVASALGAADEEPDEPGQAERLSLDMTSNGSSRSDSKTVSESFSFYSNTPT
ncbi:hypothetical protein TURU_033674 [Turdus rufiventris]|nr:hypothetical protein TURU_033674 [Turdus rufiventris]